MYSVTSYKTLYYDCLDCERHNRLHPADDPRTPWLQEVLRDTEGPTVAALDYVAATAQTIGRWMGDDYLVLGCDGFGRSEAREELRRFFEVDAENIALAALSELARVGKYPKQKLPDAVRALGLNPNKPNPVTV